MVRAVEKLRGGVVAAPPLRAEMKTLGTLTIWGLIILLWPLVLIAIPVTMAYYILRPYIILFYRMARETERHTP